MNESSDKPLEPPFLCPECGSTEADMEMLVKTEFDEGEPWRGVLRRIRCASCQYWLPVEEARAEWRKVYRATAERDLRKTRT